MESPLVLVLSPDPAPVQSSTGWTREQAANQGWGDPASDYSRAEPKVVYPRYKAHQALRLGVVQIVGGLLCIVANAVAIKAHGDVAGVGSGLFGVLYIVAGSMGVAAAKFVSKYKLVSCMILCILSAVSALAVFYWGVIGMGVADHAPHENLYPVRLSMNILLVLLAVLETVVSVWGSAICCKVACCCSPPPLLTTPLDVPLSPLGPPFGVQCPSDQTPYEHPGIPCSQSQPVLTLDQPVLDGETALKILIPSTTETEHQPPSYFSLPPSYNKADGGLEAQPNNL